MRKHFTRNPATAPIEIIQLADGGVKTRIGLTSVQKKLLIGAFLGFATSCGIAYMLWSTFLPWFEERWQPVAQYKTVYDVKAPLSSDLHQHLVLWIKSNAKSPMSDKFANLIVKETFDNAATQKVDPFVMLALMKVESNFDYTAKSNAGAIGFTQVIPKWHMDKMDNAAHVYDPKANIRIGTQVLAEYISLYKGDLQKALLQYNGSLHMPDSQYSKKVLSARQALLAFLDRQYNG
jgi:soluble lytic murein transglycosylase-like protein